MDYRGQPFTGPPVQPAQFSQPVVRRSPGCMIVAFLAGVVVAVVALVLFALSFGGADRPPLATPTPSGNDAIVVQLSKTYLTQLVQKNISSAGLPGQVSNTQVTLVHNGPLTVTGDDEVSVLGIGTTKQFKIVLQPLAQNCRVQMRVLHADLQGVPMTSFATTFESQINQQLQLNSADLPPGFTYCATGVRTEPQGAFISYSATPQ